MMLQSFRLSAGLSLGGFLVLIFVVFDEEGGKVRILCRRGRGNESGG
jgi:hypothetical protein